MIMDQTKSTKKVRTHVTIIKNNIKLLSWNIQSASSTEGNKFKDNSFSKILAGHDLVCLQETRREVHLSGYRSICNTRKDKKSGGVAILIRNELVEGIEIIKNINSTEYLICRLDNNFFKLPKDIYIVNTYIKPQNTSSSTQLENGAATLRQIEDLISDLKKTGDIILCGDFNARIGQNPGQIIEDLSDHIPLPDDYIPDVLTKRNSLDLNTNSYGKIFLNLIKNNQLIILNGRTLGDLTGNFTSIQKSGCSVIDYISVSNSLKSDIKYFKVLPFTEHSDHRPISTELRINQISTPVPSSLHEDYEKAPCRFMYSQENKDQFLNIQSEETSLRAINDINSQLQNASTIEDRESVEKSVKTINDKITEHLRGMASQCFKTTRHKENKFKQNKPWFNWQTRLAKRGLRNATNSTDNFPTSNFLRENYYKVKHSYKKILNNSKNKFFKKMNSDIENGKVLNWQSFKKLKQQKTETKDFDSYDMKRFEQFFSTLYSDNHSSINNTQKQQFLTEALNINDKSTPDINLNNPIVDEEVISVIKSLKTGKASSKDMISNELLKSLDTNHTIMLRNLFNICLTKGIYPWNCSIVTPLHKKGDKADPDNYRAVAVSSVIGKLFSTILLERLTKFRSDNCPDPPNQLGFTKKAQTYDHILTMKTIASKYKKLNKPVYAIFVDFKKAFDSVCRQALFLKLAKCEVSGKFFSVLRNMYQNSYAYIKLSGHLSKKISINKGTEQGHPLSPDLFKLFLNDLSPLVNFPNCPKLSNLLVSHLLWADDLILLALDKATAQKQLDALANYCSNWGIEINELKTQVVIFQKEPPQKFDGQFILNSKPLEIVESYCYLGILLHHSGKVAPAEISLKTKAMRAFFGLKRSVMRSKLSFNALTTLFDSLIKPIVLYGAPVWAPESSVWASITKNFHSDNQALKTIGNSTQEKVHLSFLKWALGVHKKASNIGVWGESGRAPLVFQSVRLSLNYLKRLENMRGTSFVAAALNEQKKLNLPWYAKLKPLLEIDEIFSQNHVSAFQTLNPKSKIFCPSTNIAVNNSSLNNNTINLHPMKSRKFRTLKIVDSLKNWFTVQWEKHKSTSPKLSYYNSIKSVFKKEPYLDQCMGFSRRYCTTQLRISAHDLQIERGRYVNMPRNERICTWCKTTLGQNIIEDEKHTLFDCDLYSTIRTNLIENLNKYRDERRPLISHSNLKDYLMQTLSPHCSHSNNISSSTSNINSLNNPPQLNDTKSPDERRTCSINSICTYIFKSSEERKKLLESARDLNRALSHINANKLVIQLNTSPNRSQVTEVTTA